MAIVDPAGELSFWFEGFFFGGYYARGSKGNEMQFWFEGSPYAFIFPVRTGF